MIDTTIERKARRAIGERELASLFLDARSANGFLPEAVPRETLRRIVELAELGPTAANSTPMRLTFVESAAAKERLRPHLSAGNLEKTMAAPVTAIVAADLHFYEHFPRLFPHRDMRAMFAGEANAAKAGEFAFMNATLQGAYLMIAARALGLDAGPMGGFDRAGVDAEFFPGGTVKSIWLVNLGYGDDTKLFERLPRFDPDDVATFL